MKKLDKPIIAYLIIIVCSTAVSILMFKVGESLAEVTGNSKTLAGLSFKASGSLGGFIIIFWLSQRVILRFSKEMVSNTKRNMKVYLIGNPEPFEIGAQYECNYTLFDENTGERKEGTSQQRWEAGHLTVVLPTLRTTRR